MTNIDMNRSFEARQSGDAAFPSTNRAAGAEELKGLLSVIADQINTADRRHTNVLAEMRDRLTVLGEDTRAVRTQVAGDLGPVFTRIEDALSQLAGRMGDPRDEHMTDRAYAPAPSEPQTPVQSMTQHAPQNIPQNNPHGAAPQPASHGTPAVLRSVSPGPQTPPQVFARAGDVGRTPAHSSSIDTFDVVDASMPSGHSEPWDSEQAEALTRVYEDEPAPLSHQGYGDEPLARGPMSYSSDPVLHSSHGYQDEPMQRNAPAYHGAAAPHIERDWLEARFADIAERIERSLAVMNPDSPVESLSQRFEMFEQRFGEALHEVATRADMEGLRLIEGQIGELAGHVEQAHAQLSRLDDIEHQISAVIEQIANQSAHAEAGAAPQAFDPQDLERVAEMAAEQVAQRFAASFESGSAEGTATEIRQLLETFISERRQGDEQTMTMLDTLQQALIRVLDRVDAIEIAQHSAAQASLIPAAGAAHYGMEGHGSGASAFDQGYASHDEPAHGEPQRHQSSVGARPFGGAPATRSLGDASPFDGLRNDDIAPLGYQDAEGGDYAAEAYPATGAAFDHAMDTAAENAHGYGQTPAYNTPAYNEAGAGHDQGYGQPYGQAPAAAAPASFRPSIEKMRQDFIADAQRAKMKASANQPANSSGDEAVPLRSPAQARVTQIPAAAPASGAEPKKIFGLSPKAIAIALAAIVAINGALLMLSGGSNAPVEAPVPQAAPAAASAPAAPAKAKAPAAVEAPAAAKAPAASGTPAAPAPSSSQPAPPQVDVMPKASASPPADSNRNAAPQKRSDIPGANTLAGAAGDAQAEAGVVFEEPSTGQDVTPSPDLVAASQGAIPGLRVQIADQLPSAEDFVRIRQQQNTAKMSEQLAAKATELMTPAAYLAETPGTTAAATGEATPGTEAATGQSASSHLDLPPATVGPLSLRLAAAKGDPSAQFEVGARLAEGKGTNQNFTEAMRWYNRSAAQGFAQAQYRLGTLYERGLGTKADLAHARDWYQRAAEQGNVKAMHNLAVLSAGNNGSSGPDYQTASMWFGKAAERGLQDSQYNLGVLYESGLGVGKDLKMAYKWFALAARAGDKDSVRRRDAALAELPAAERGAAEALVRDFVPAMNNLLINDARAAGEDWKKRQTLDDNT